MEGETACIIVNSFIPYYEETGHWQALAWWIHDNIPEYADLEFYRHYAAFNISWHEKPQKYIYSYVEPKGYLKKAGDNSHNSDHSDEYEAFLRTLKKSTFSIT